MKGFGSDNHSGVHPRILKAIERANTDHAPSYGTDNWSDKADEMFHHLFSPSTSAFFVFNGTAANVLSLSALVRPHHAVLASSYSHLVNDECGAPERNLGCRIINIECKNAKLTPELLSPHLIRRGDQHASQIRAISITQPTELGTVYTVEEIKKISEFARAQRLYLHMDGARLVNAATYLNCNLKDLTCNAGVDVLSLGGTKNGLLFGEAVLFFNQNSNESLDFDFKYVRKQLMQLPSKTRFIAAQFLEFLGTDLWIENSIHANLMAKKLADRLSTSKYCEITQPTQSNAVFVKIPKKMVAPLRSDAFFYVWNEHTFECRLMTTWDTTDNEVLEFADAVERIGHNLIAEAK